MEEQAVRRIEAANEKATKTVFLLNPDLFIVIAL